MNLLSGPIFSGRCRIRKGPYYQGFLYREYNGHFAGTKGTVRNREVSVLERCL